VWTPSLYSVLRNFLSITNCTRISWVFLSRFQVNRCRIHSDTGNSLKTSQNSRFLIRAVIWFDPWLMLTYCNSQKNRVNLPVHRPPSVICDSSIAQRKHGSKGLVHSKKNFSVISTCSIRIWEHGVARHYCGLFFADFLLCLPKCILCPNKTLCHNCFPGPEKWISPDAWNTTTIVAL
jgi:hypothetical protein